ncbi:hypothetical protein COW36_11225 [bacterium (Candidatus Blackallbacteria) CG17_big_fil_post_rev_8_21_14_2_50_48_46]|uniref:Uncharacterized protein n=1 Tax=bacterium (Candidatus Blackallbacteria) CG17_big_fil_post_rev_8_21_14_2_50_48_46 TaxID=2014261 RepID=A0A2M7G4K4_9BACT|nr:MAG: hypothetical protein COW64_18320 [bacterium (Candidatus Blackallbacteria) CG18_big_fil_WC_8_21_14_2_50_49_26]PIW16846.1 MAG: hypothetical protein COW36_11225 [bacterium (Candidatus Blackallbacteria) CG17_big_fil_post_rev_8_21_14_2_50_48_46]PIW48043.1 MAG: hypothetical protein COW20_10940 [bacterium (Candidatus Blackallbacteria) CG13_big_fil_rev_8_21_14_2_50_49_14]
MLHGIQFVSDTQFTRKPGLLYGFLLLSPLRIVLSGLSFVLSSVILLTDKRLPAYFGLVLLANVRNAFEFYGGHSSAYLVIETKNKRGPYFCCHF